MKIPDLSEILDEIYLSVDNVAVEDTEFGDEENENVTIPVIIDLTATVSYYASPTTKTPYARITWTWSTPIMVDEDGVEIDPEDPEIADDINIDPVVDYLFGTNIEGGLPAQWTSTYGSGLVVTEDHPLGINVTGSVRAVLKSGITGPPASFPAVVLKDTTPPPKTSAPVVSSNASVVTVEYDGKDEFGVLMPDDLYRVTIRADTISPPVEIVGHMPGKGAYTFYKPAGSLIYVQLVAEDYSRNVGVSSDIVSHVVKSILDDTDLEEALSNAGTKDWHQDDEPDDPGEGDWWYLSDGSVFFRLGGVWVQKQWSTLAIADSAISVAKLGSGSVTRDKISPGAVGSSEIADFAIAVKKLNNTKHYLY